jgi:DNA-binding transcriptional MocR family regulator
MNMPLPTSQVNIPPGVIDLGAGNPPFSLLPLDLLRTAAESCFARGDPAFLQYGAEQGDGYFRLALADILTAGYGFPVDAGHLFVTNGISNALDLLCTLFTRPGDTIFVEEPSYFLALRVFADHGLRVVSIDTDEDGLVVELLEEKFRKGKPKFLYVIPTHQNPSGHTLTEERRARLVKLAQENNFLILADEVYHFLSYDSQPPKAFAAWTSDPHILSLGSFSKILAPGLRLGWIQAHHEKIQTLAGCGLLDSGGGLNPFTSAVVREVIESGGLTQNISQLKDIYSHRRMVMDSALRRQLPELTWKVPQGGYFFWVRLPRGLDAAELQQQALDKKVIFRPGVRFSSRNGLRDYIRLSFVFYEPEEIEEGILRLKKCLDPGTLPVI